VLKNLLNLLTLLAIFSGASFAKPKPVPENLDRVWKKDFTAPRTMDKIHVVNWNIDRGTHFDQIAAALERENPDLCFLQEVDLTARRSGGRNVSEELARRLQLNYAFAPEFQELSQGTTEQPSFQGEAILTRLPMHNVRILRFKEQSGFWQPHAYLPNLPIMQRRLGGRIALVAELELANGGMMVVYNAHLESRSFGHIQAVQLDEILEDAKRYPENTPIVLAGDLNTKYNPWTFSSKLRRAGWTSAFGKRTPRTHILVCALDWVVVRGAVKIESGKVLRGIGASDHFPITADLFRGP